jgi:hypothetical protein
MPGMSGVRWPCWCLLAAMLVLEPLAARGADCDPWPGEPSPLPRVGDADPLRWRWAELRAQELALRAEALEANAPLAANRAWRRVLCLSPGDSPAQQGVQRTRALHVHRPEIRPEPAPIGQEAAADTDRWAALDATLWLAPAPPRIALPPRLASNLAQPRNLLDMQRALTLQSAERLLAEAEAQVAAARFEESLATAAEARERLSALPPGRLVTARKVRLEVIEATAEAARGRDDAARACFERALALAPDFALDPATTSPKLLRLLDSARFAAQAPR